MQKIGLFSLLLCVCLNAFAQDKPIQLAYSTTESIPYQLGTGSAIASPPGLAVEIIEKAAKELRINVEFQRIPNRRLLHHLRHGDIDGIFIHSYHINREEVAVYPMRNGEVDTHRSIASLNYHLYQLQGKKPIWDGNKFTEKQLVIGILAGYSIFYELQNHNVSFLEINTREQLIELLTRGRIDAIAAQDSTFDMFLTKQNTTDITKAFPVLRSKHYYVIFNHQFYKNNKQLVEAFWDEIVDAKNQIVLAHE